MTETDTSPEAARIAEVRQNLRIALAIRKTTAAEVSLGAGLSKNALGAYLRGDSSISYANLLRVCDVLEAPIGVLHIPGAITPARMRLHATLAQTPPEVIEEALRLLEGRARSDQE